MSAESASTATSPLVEYFPATVIKQTNFRVDSDTPCRFLFTFPIELPSLLRPELPPLPYYPPDHRVDDAPFQRQLFAALRPAVAGALYELLGTDAPVSELVPRPGRITAGWLKQKLESNEICGDGSLLDLATGHWTDQRGVSGDEVKAYLDWGPGVGFSVVHGFVLRVDQKVLDNDTDPAVVRIRAMATLHKGQVAFLARKCHPAQQGDINREIRRHEGP